MNECYNIVVVVKVAIKNQIAVATAARLFFLTAVAISIAMRPFKFREISVSKSTRSFVSSIHSFAYKVHSHLRWYTYA